MATKDENIGLTWHTTKVKVLTTLEQGNERRGVACVNKPVPYSPLCVTDTLRLGKDTTVCKGCSRITLEVSNDRVAAVTTYRLAEISCTMVEHSTASAVEPTSVRATVSLTFSAATVKVSVAVRNKV